MIRRFFSRWFALGVLGLLLLLLFVVQGMAGALVGWLLLGYLVWRAFPAILSDLRRLWRTGKNYRSNVARF